MTRVKVLSRNAVFAWNPKPVQPLCFVAGTSAQQFDASFSSAASLDMCIPDLTDSVVELAPKNSATVLNRFHKIIWTCFNNNPGSENQGTIIGGCDNGQICLYDAFKLFSQSESESKIGQSQAHNGQVLSLDSNIFQPQLVASGASVSEVFIWDLNQPDKPMSPGPKQQPLDHVVSVDWNKKVPHILGTLSPGRAILWDLRKGDGPILSLGDLGARAQWKEMCWHPEEATSLCLACQDDQFPVVQSWDVRYANSPILQLQGHQKGILSMDWCPADPDLLVTCSKDKHILLWNPNTGTFLAEIPYAASNWPHQVAWCPTNPNLIGCASVDSRVTLYSLVGGTGIMGATGHSPVPSPKLAESFPGADFSLSGSGHFHSAAAFQQQQEVGVKLPQVPRWLRPGPCGARFAFGNRLITFEKGPFLDAHTDPASVQRFVTFSQVVTNEHLRERAEELENALSSGSPGELCVKRGHDARTDEEKTLWKFLKAHCEGAGRKDYALALGIDAEESRRQLRAFLGAEDSWKIGKSVSSDHSVGEKAENGSVDGSQSAESEEAEPSDALAESKASWFSGGMLAAARQPLILPTDPNCKTHDGMLTEAVVNGDIGAAVELCVREGSWADAFQLAISGGSDLFVRLQKRYATEMAKQGKSASRLVALLTGQNWTELIEQTDLGHWRQIMGLMLNFAPAEKFMKLAVELIERMRSEGSPNEQKFACLPCVAAGNVENLIACLRETTEPTTETNENERIVDLIEKASVLRWSVGGGSQRVVKSGSEFCAVLRKYSELLLNQGCLENALHLLASLPEGQTDDQKLEFLKDRLYGCCGVRRSGRPFTTVNIVPQGVKRIPQVPQQMPVERVDKNQGVAARQLPVTPSDSYDNNGAADLISLPEDEILDGLKPSLRKKAKKILPYLEGKIKVTRSKLQPVYPNSAVGSPLPDLLSFLLSENKEPVRPWDMKLFMTQLGAIPPSLFSPKGSKKLVPNKQKKSIKPSLSSVKKIYKKSH